jgi:hypothetical protein
MKWEMVTGRARIIAPPHLVWQWVAHPRSWMSWIPKIDDVVPYTLDPPGPGWRFRIAYRMAKLPRLAEAELVAFEPGLRLVCRTSGGDLKPGGEILETYTLQADEDTTVLTHAVDLSHSRMPLFARAAAVILNGMFNGNARLGHVANLKQLIEDGVAPPKAG